MELPVFNNKIQFLNKSGIFIPNYVKLSDIQNHSKLGDFFDNQNPIPDESSLMILNLNFPFNEFMNNTSDVYADDMKISSLYLYDWLDNNNDTKITSDELSMINRAGFGELFKNYEFQNLQKNLRESL